MGVELAPVEAILDETHQSLPTSRDQNCYTLGRIAAHNVVIAVLSEIGNNNAAIVATQLLNDFRSIRFGLLVGIGGGIPGDDEDDIRLGDVVVSKPTATFGGVVQFDRGKIQSNRQFERTGTLKKPPAVLMANVSKLEAQHRRIGNQISKYLLEMLERFPYMEEEYSYPGMEQDQLFEASYNHEGEKSCQLCDRKKVVKRALRKNTTPRIHYGTIGSANEVIKDSKTRDKLRKDLGILCVEMEAAGLMDDFSCLVIRGICDYADSHKNKKWQPYAAATAAAYAKELLSIIPAQEIVTTTKEQFHSLLSKDPTTAIEKDQGPTVEEKQQDPIGQKPLDGKLVASASRDKTVRLWDSATGGVRRTLKGHLDDFFAVAFSPDGKLVASASRDKTVRLWDSATGAVRRTLEGHSGWVKAVAFSPDGKLVASASYDETVRLWDSATGAARCTLKGHSRQVSAVAFSPDGKLVASASYDKTVRLWDSATGAAHCTLKGHSRRVTAVAFSPVE
jgi:nucleoside phosphorylase/roadblock/LC7 domain-containing protein